MIDRLNVFVSDRFVGILSYDDSIYARIGEVIRKHVARVGG